MPRFYMMGTYSADGMKGIVGGSDRAAAVDAVVKAVGGLLIILASHAASTI